MFKKTSMIRPVLFIVVLSTALGVLLGFVQNASKEQIEINFNFEKQKALLYTVDIDTENKSKEEINMLYKSSLRDEKLRGIYYYVYYEEGIVKGYCFPFTGKGLWGNISGYIAVDSEANSLMGIVFTNHSETPGLGARIDELWFKDQFRGIDISFDGEYVFYDIGDGAGLDAITGATMTSDSVKSFVNRSINEIKKIVKEDLSE